MSDQSNHFDYCNESHATDLDLRIPAQHLQKSSKKLAGGLDNVPTAQPADAKKAADLLDSFHRGYYDLTAF